MKQAEDRRYEHRRKADHSAVIKDADAAAGVRGGGAGDLGTDQREENPNGDEGHVRWKGEANQQIEKRFEKRDGCEAISAAHPEEKEHQRLHDQKGNQNPLQPRPADVERSPLGKPERKDDQPYQPRAAGLSDGGIPYQRSREEGPIPGESSCHLRKADHQAKQHPGDGIVRARGCYPESERQAEHGQQDVDGNDDEPGIERGRCRAYSCKADSGGEAASVRTADDHSEDVSGAPRVGNPLEDPSPREGLAVDLLKYV